MSTIEEIQEVYLTDLVKQYREVRQKHGVQALLGGLRGCHIHELYWGLGMEDIRVIENPAPKPVRGTAPKRKVR